MQGSSNVLPTGFAPQAANSYLRLTAAVAFLAVSSYGIAVLTASRTDGPMGLFGSPALWLCWALIVIGISILNLEEERHRPLLYGFAVLYGATLTLTPFLTNGMPVRPIGFQYYGFVEYTLINHRLDPASIWYHSWPHFSVLFASLLNVTGLTVTDVSTVMGVFPFAVSMSKILLLAAMLHRVAPKPERLGLPLLLVSPADWTGQDYFSAQGLAVVVSLAYALALACERRFVALVLFAALVLTHLPTATVALIATFIFLAVRRPTTWGLLLLTSSAVYVAWLLHGGIEIVTQQLPVFLKEALRFDRFWFFSFAARFPEGSIAHPAIRIARLSETVILAALASVGGVNCWRKFRRIPSAGMLLMFFSVSGVGLAATYHLLGESIFRAYLFTVPLLVFFAAWFPSVRFDRAILSLVIAVLTVTYSLVVRPTDVYDATSAAEVRGVFTLYDKAVGGATIVGTVPFVRSLRQQSFRSRDIEVEMQLGYAFPPSLSQEFLTRVPGAIFIVISRYFTGLLKFHFGGTPPLIAESIDVLDRSPHFGRIYANGGAIIYTRQWQAPVQFSNPCCLARWISWGECSPGT